METEANRAWLLEKANALPLCPGVYLMRDKQGKVIYVGKSAKLKHRVSQYFQSGEKNLKTARMVSLVRDFDYYLCDTEMEALSLENTLIKQYNPKYNIRLKDAKTYPYIKLTDEEYPRMLFTRVRAADKARYFGPFSGAGTVYSLIELLRRTLKLPSCNRSFPRDIGKGRPCIYYQMKRCAGLCTGDVSVEEHQRSMQYAADILNGKVKEVRQGLEEEMYAHAEAERFEAAARCRDTIQALDALKGKQKVIASPDVEQDIVALYSDDLCTAVSVFYIRAGVLQDKADFLFGADGILEIEDMTAFLCEHYRTREYVPPTILLAFPMEEEEQQTLSTYLSTLAGRKIHIHVPERGQRKTLCEMVEKNVAEQARLYKMNAARSEGMLTRLAELLALEVYPERIEAYDISNLGSEHLTAGMIVCRDGKFFKRDYRHFHIRSVKGNADDYASMREVIARRLEHLTDTEGSFATPPDLILLDGGRAHVSVVRELMRQKGIEIPVFGMVKDEFHKTRALCTDAEEISIAREGEVFGLIYRIQEEVHRFTVSRMENAKRKTMKTSSLTKIDGIGEAKAKKLMLAMGTLKAIKTATKEALLSVKGISSKDAEAIWNYFHRESDTEEES